MQSVELLGFAGAILILFGFYRTSIGRWTNTSFWHELDNLVGSSLLIVYHLMTETYATMILSLVWAIVAFRGLTTFAERYQHSHINKNKKKGIIKKPLN